MQWWAYLAWGAFGGALVEGLDFGAAIRRIGDWPWNAVKKLRATPYLTAIAVRLIMGGGLALAAGMSGLVSSPLAAVTLGIATPLMVSKLGELTSAEYGRVES